jgi:GST-like protein
VPYLGGRFGHFYTYAPAKIEYAIDRPQSVGA